MFINLFLAVQDDKKDASTRIIQEYFSKCDSTIFIIYSSRSRVSISFDFEQELSLLKILISYSKISCHNKISAYGVLDLLFFTT